MLKINKDTKIERKRFNWREHENLMPEVGMLGTEYVGSDRYSVVCVKVNSPKRITVCRLWGLDDGMVDNNPDIMIDDEGIMWMEKNDWEKDKYSCGKEEIWSLRQNNRWCESGASRRSSSISWGIASPYRDPNF